MHIVLVTHYYPPEVNAPAQRAADHAKVWREAGHEVTIITAQPSHPYGRVYEGYTNETTEEIVDGIRVLRLKTVLGANAGRVKRTLNYASFFLTVRQNMGRIKSADIVISTSPQFFCGLAGRPLAKKLGCPWILEIRDIWPESIIAVGAAKPSLATKALTALADGAYRDTDKIVSVSPGFDGHFRSRGVPEEKVVLIPNGINAASATPPAAAELPELSPLKGRFVAAYIGTFGMAHSVSTLLDAAHLLKDDPRIGLLLVGSGAERDQLLERHQALGLQNTVILDQQPRERIQQIYGHIDASIVHLKKQDVFKTVIPTKLLEGMAMGKPMLVGVEGTARDILNAAGGGLSFEPESAEGLATVLRQLADDKDTAAAYAASGQAYVAREFDRSEMASRYLALMESLTGHVRSRAA